MALPSDRDSRGASPEVDHGPDDGAMVVLRYPKRSLRGDYLRSAIGLGIGGGVLLSVPPSPAIVLIFGGIAVLFAVFGLRTVQRQLLQVAVTDEEIATSDLRTRTMGWNELTRVRVRVYGMRRNRTRMARGGFVELMLQGPAGKMRFESSLEGFELLAWHAARAVRRYGVTIDSTSSSNLIELGIDPDGDQAPPVVEQNPSGGGSG